MATEKGQFSFSAGELSPSLYGRVDLEQYQVGLALARNWMVDYRGGIRTRPGTRFCDQAPGTGDVRLIPFIVASDISYVLVFYENLVRIMFDGAWVLDGGSPLVLTTPYSFSDLALLKFTQSVDVMTLVHPNYPVYNLSRTGASTFTFTEELHIPAGQIPPNLSAFRHGGAAFDYYYGYCVTAVTAEGEESAPSFPASVNGDLLNSKDISNSLFWGAITGADRYNIYKWGPIHNDTLVGTVFGFIGQATITQFTDNNIAPDFSRTPPQLKDPFSPGQISAIAVTAGGTGYTPVYVPLTITDVSGTGASAYGVVEPGTTAIVAVVVTAPGKNYVAPTITGAHGGTFTTTLGESTGTYPETVEYFQQRKVFGGTLDSPVSLVFSKTGAFTDFDTSPTVQDTDSITVTLASRLASQIKSLIDTPNGLIVFTSGSSFLVSGGSPNAALTPTTVSALRQGSSGANDVPPIFTPQGNVLYVQNRGNIVRDFAFNFYAQNYSGNDRSILANHFFRGYKILEWAWSEEPYRTLWCVRDDGKLLGFAYVDEQQVYGWSQHDTQGTYQSICSVPEGGENAVYVSVRRGGITLIERFMQDEISDPLNAWCVDAGLQYVGAPETVISGLDHLNGFSVVGIADGLPVGPFTVTAGTVTLSQPASNVILGLGYTCDAQTLAYSGQDAQGKRKNVAAVTGRMLNSRLPFVGPTFNDLTLMKTEQPIPYSVPPPFFSGDTRTIVANNFSKGGQICIRVTDPVPCNILALVPEIVMGDVRS